jgi:hypothetical protein
MGGAKPVKRIEAIRIDEMNALIEDLVVFIRAFLRIYYVLESPAFRCCHSASCVKLIGIHS